MNMKHSYNSVEEFEKDLIATNSKLIDGPCGNRPRILSALVIETSGKYHAIQIYR